MIFLVRLGILLGHTTHNRLYVNGKLSANTGVTIAHLAQLRFLSEAISFNRSRSYTNWLRELKRVGPANRSKWGAEGLRPVAGIPSNEASAVNLCLREVSRILRTLPFLQLHG